MPFAAVAEQAEVAVGVVAVVAAVQRFAVDAAAGIELADGVVLQAALFVVLVVADECALLTKCFQATRKSVAGEALAVEVDGFEGTAFLVVVVQAVAVGQAAVAELAECVVLVTQGGPTLVFADEAVLQVVFVGQWLFTVFDGIGLLQTSYVIRILKNRCNFFTLISY